MIYKGTLDIIQIYLNRRDINALYKGDRLVWEAIRSCFGKGYWLNGKPWKNDDAWKNY